MKNINKLLNDRYPMYLCFVRITSKAEIDATGCAY